MGPLQQGHLDGLCGVYAVINAVNIVQGPLRKPANRALFETCLQYLASRRCLIQRMTGYGTDGSELNQLLKIVQQHYPLHCSTPFRQRRTLKFEQYWQECHEFLRVPQSIILVNLKGYHQHWTLIERMTETTLYLHDSSGLKYLSKRNCQLTGKRPLRPHLLNPQHTYFLRGITL